MRILWLVPLSLILVAVMGGIILLRQNKKKAAAARAAAPSPAAPAAGQTGQAQPARKFSLAGVAGFTKAALRLVVVVGLAWWLGSSIYRWVRTPKIPKTPTSGIFVLKAGSELVHTGIFSQPGHWERYEQLGPPKKFWRKNNDGNHLEIASSTFTVGVTEPGEIQLIPGPENVTVRVALRKANSLFPFSY